jgi:hypothetical protein
VPRLRAITLEQIKSSWSKWDLSVLAELSQFAGLASSKCFGMNEGY